MAKTSVIQLELSSMAHLGQALGRHQGQVVFVPYAIPGEVVRARVVEERKRWARAELLEVLEPSPLRIEPPCPYFGRCGGCHWQHIAYPAQLEYKGQVVREQLQRLGGIADPPVRPARGAPLPDMEEPWFYRNHVQFAVDEAGRLGFQAAHSHEVVPVERCLLLHPLLDELHAALDVDWPDLRRLILRAGVHTGDQMCIFETPDDQPPDLEVDMPVSCVVRLRDGHDVPLIGEDFYEERLRDKRFTVSSSSFFQVNTAGAEALLEVVEGQLAPQKEDTLLDLYCGVGAIGLSLLERVGRVIGVEAHPAAIADAQENAARLDAAEERVALWAGKVEDLLPEIAAAIAAALGGTRGGAPLKAVLDPPRGGCKPQVMERLLDLGPQRIVYVSCEPAILARDAKALAAGGYTLVEVQPLDMFPQTYHVETVALWRREAGA